MKYFYVIIICLFLFSCKKDEKIDNSWKSITIEKGRSIRTMVEVLYEGWIDIDTNQYRIGLIYSTNPNVGTGNGTAVDLNNLITYYSAGNSIQYNNSLFLPGLQPNTTYYIKAFKIKKVPYEKIISQNELTITTTNEIIYNNISMTESYVGTMYGYRVGNPVSYFTDYFSKVGYSLNNYNDMIRASIKVYIDDVPCQTPGLSLSVLTEGSANKGASDHGPKNFQPSFENFSNNPQSYVAGIDDMFVSVPCDFGPGNHTIKASIDGYWITSITSNYQSAHTINSTGITLNKTTAIHGDRVYMNGMDSLSVVRSLGALTNETTYVYIGWDEILHKAYLYINTDIDKGTNQIRLYTACDNPVIGTLQIQ